MDLTANLYSGNAAGQHARQQLERHTEPVLDACLTTDKVVVVALDTREHPKVRRWWTAPGDPSLACSYNLRVDHFGPRYPDQPAALFAVFTLVVHAPERDRRLHARFDLGNKNHVAALGGMGLHRQVVFFTEDDGPAPMRPPTPGVAVKLDTVASKNISRILLYAAECGVPTLSKVRQSRGGSNGAEYEDVTAAMTPYRTDASAN